MASKQNRVSTSKRQAVQEERRKKEQQKRLRQILYIVGGALLVVLLAFAINAFVSKDSGKIAQSEIITITPRTRPQVDGHSMGDPNAPVKILEYSDFQCPYCKQFADTTEQALIDNFIATGKVFFTYHSMGNFVSQNIGQGGTESRDSAEASYCAGDQEKFWEYRDILFANSLGEDQGYFARSRLEKMAEAIGLDLSQFNKCLDSKQFRAQVNQDYADGIAAGVTGTPSFIINGKLITGAQPIEVFQQEIEAAIQAVGN